MYSIAALDYHMWGYSPLPIPTGAKYPPPAGWTGGGAPMASQADVESWDETHGDWNVALRLPPGVLGVDVDAYGDKAGADTLATWERLAGEALPQAPWTTSRTDGVSGIRLYRVPVGLTLRSPGPGIDLVTHEHRYVMAPPSVVADRSYHWRVELLPAAELPWLPDKLLSPLRAPERVGTTEPGHDLTRGNPSLAATYVRGYMHEVNTGGSRHDAMQSALCWAWREANAGLAPWPHALGRLRGAWDGTAAADLDRRTDQAEWDRMVAWAQENALNGPLAPGAATTGVPAQLTPQAAVGAVGGRVEAPGNQEPVQPPDGSWGRLWTPEEVIAKAAALPDGGVAVEGGGRLCPPGSLTLLTGEDGSGKTSLALRLGLSSTAGTVLLVAEDAGPAVLAQRMRELPEEDRARLSISRPSMPSALDPSWEALSRGGWGAVVLDAVSGFLALDGLDGNSTEDVKGWAQRVARRFGDGGAAVLILDHPPQARKGEAPDARASGSVQKRAAADYGLHLSRVDQGVGRITVTKDNLTLWQPGTRVRVAWSRGLGGIVTTGLSLWPEDEDETTRGVDRRIEEAADVLLAAARAEYGSSTWLKTSWVRTLPCPGHSRTTREAALQAALDLGGVEAVGQGVYRVTSA